MIKMATVYRGFLNTQEASSLEEEIAQVRIAAVDTVRANTEGTRSC